MESSIARARACATQQIRIGKRDYRLLDARSAGNSGTIAGGGGGSSGGGGGKSGTYALRLSRERAISKHAPIDAAIESIGGQSHGCSS